MFGEQRVAGYWSWAGLFAAAMCVAGWGCSSRVGVDQGEPDLSVAASELGKHQPLGRAAYYRLRRAEAPCDSSRCGGYVVFALRERQLACPDGSLAPQCDVAELKFDGDLPEGEEYVVRGRFARKRVRGRHSVSVFHAEAVWVTDEPVTPAEDEHFFVVSSLPNCADQPCPTVRAQQLNTPRRRSAFQVEWQLDRARCPAEEFAAARQAMQDGELMVLGKLEGSGVIADKLVASRVFSTSPVPGCSDAGSNRLCESDTDCEWDHWCRESGFGPRQCVPYKQHGETCFWASSEPWVEERCQIGIEWCESSSSPSRPGICRTACKGICPVGEWCSPSGCTPAGTCLADIDCWRYPGWDHDGCIGYPSCERSSTGGSFGACTWHCGNPACMDISSHHLGGGDDEYVMGYGTLDGACAPLLGVPSAAQWAPPLFDTIEECQATCETPE